MNGYLDLRSADGKRRAHIYCSVRPQDRGLWLVRFEGEGQPHGGRVQSQDPQLTVEDAAEYARSQWVGADAKDVTVP